MREFVITLLCLSLGGSLLAVTLMLLRRLCGQRLTGRFYYYVWLIVLLRFVLPVPGLVSVPALSPQAAAPDSAYVEPVTVQGVSAVPYGVNPALTAKSVTGRPRPVNNYVFTGIAGTRTEAVIYDNGQAVYTENTSAYSAKESAAEAGAWGGLWQSAKKLLSSWDTWFCVWAAGAAISFAVCVASYCRFARQLRRTELIPQNIDLEVYFSMPGRRKPGLICSRCVTTPMLIGLFNPTIVLPDRRYTPEMLNNIFAHELEHYRRGDIAYKWFAAVVSALHWFNPLVYIMHDEIDSACELSCDEQVLRYMSYDEKRSYGETILTLAAAGTLSPSVMATSFATQKRDLKERLSQIINFKARSVAAVAVSLAMAVLLLGCGVALGPNTAQGGGVPAAAPTVAPAPLAAEPVSVNTQQDAADSVIQVSTVDEFLSAIGSNRTIILNPGTYELSTASDYGQERPGNAPYFWEKVYDGSQLVIDGVSGLKIEASNDVSLTTASDYATTLTIKNSADISIAGLKIGRAGLEYAYNSDALGFNSCERVSVTGCELYSSGNSGIRCETCADVSAVNCKIYDCGNAAVWCRDSENVYLEDCEIYDCAWGEYGVIFSIHNARGFVVTSCDIHDNESTALITSNGSSLAYILGCEVAQGNTFSKELFGGYGGKIYVGGCLFNGTSTWPRLIGDSENVVPLGLDGDKLTYADIAKMELTQIDPPENAARAVFTPPELEKTVNAEGYTVVNVSTVDELLAAIDSKTIINLAPGTYDFSTAGNCGGYGSRRYRWEGMGEDSQLIIMGVKDICFVADPTADEPTELICGSPPFIMEFRTCSGVSFEGISMHAKAGNKHSVIPLDFSYVDSISLSRCKLYDCNLGINASECSGIEISETEISNCEDNGVLFSWCDNISLSDCNFNNCGWADGNFLNCENVTYNNTPLENGTYTFSNIA